MKIYLIVLIFVLSCIRTSVANVTVSTENQLDVIISPSGDLQMRVWLNNGSPYYMVELNGEAVIEASKIGFISNIGDFSDGLKFLDAKPTYGNETWHPVVGESALICDCYNGADLRFINTAEMEITIEVRVYDTGAAFRYILPDVPTDYTITDELTQFVFPAGAIAQAHVDQTQTQPTSIQVEKFSSFEGYQRPLTIELHSGAVVTICEGNLKNFAAMTLRHDPTTLRSLRVRLGEKNDPVIVSGSDPSATPWRVIVVAEELRKLPLNNTIVMNLNDKSDEKKFQFSEWVKPGKNLALGAGRETTLSLHNWIDCAKANGLEYVLFDYGWYGPELDDRCDPRLDPSKLEPETEDSAEMTALKDLLKNYIYEDSRFDASGERWFPPYGLLTKEPVWSAEGRMSHNVNIRDVCAYANSQGVGMILYVNGRHLFDRFGRYTVDELFDRFEEWGAAGVKPGFVTVRDQMSEKRNLEMIESAARHKLILTIHDEYVTTGIERTFPNCLTTEGILGDEGTRTADVPGDINKLFTRCIQGPADHTFCYPGKATRGYALASSMMFRTGLNSLYWYGNPSFLARLRTEEKKFWADMPANWDDFVIPEAKMSSYATYARKSGDDWYFGSISAVPRVMSVPLDFLDPGVEYVAEIYQDDIDVDAYNNPSAPLICVSYIVDRQTSFTHTMGYGTGFAARIRPIISGDTGLTHYLSFLSVKHFESILKK